MEVYDKKEMDMQEERLLHIIHKGGLFIYPTDTIYGIGCNAKDDNAVMKIRDVKKRERMPFSVIVPNKKWIYDNCEIDDDAKKWIEEKLPGAYTLILKLHNKEAISKHVAPETDTIGIRIPDHWCSGLASTMNIPIITTSANISGENFMTSLDNLNPKIKGHTDFIIYEGELNGRPSKIIDFSKEKMEIRVR